MRENKPICYPGDNCFMYKWMRNTHLSTGWSSFWRKKCHAALFQLNACVFEETRLATADASHSSDTSRQNSCAPSLTPDPICTFAANWFAFNTPVYFDRDTMGGYDSALGADRKTTFLMSFTRCSKIPLIILLMPLCPFLQAKRFLFMLPAGNISDELLRLLSSPV